MIKWEYKTVNDIIYGYQMNELGKQGWELVSYNEYQEGGFVGRVNRKYIFKRQIIE